jgi:hypothetical protein
VVAVRLQDVLGPGGEPLGDGPGGEGAVVGELGGLFAEIVGELGNAGEDRGGEQRAGMCVFPLVLGGGAAGFGGGRWSVSVQAPT